MSQSLDELKMTLSVLPVPQRAELAYYLLETLDDEDDGASDAWLALANQRLTDLHAGTVSGVPLEEVTKSLRKTRL
jgi:putative addiction module component (TIGR02574 family)